MTHTSEFICRICRHQLVRWQYNKGLQQSCIVEHVKMIVDHTSMLCFINFWHIYKLNVGIYLRVLVNELSDYPLSTLFNMLAGITVHRSNIPAGTQ